MNLNFDEMFAAYESAQRGGLKFDVRGDGSTFRLDPHSSILGELPDQRVCIGPREPKMSRKEFQQYIEYCFSLPTNVIPMDVVEWRVLAA